MINIFDNNFEFFYRVDNFIVSNLREYEIDKMNDRDILKLISGQSNIITEFVDKLEDKQFLLKAINKNYSVYRFIKNEKLRKDKDILIATLKDNFDFIEETEIKDLKQEIECYYNSDVKHYYKSKETNNFLNEELNNYNKKKVEKI